MPDITLCHGGDCPQKEQCYRFTASPSMRQSYFAEPPHKGAACEYHLPIYERKEPRDES